MKKITRTVDLANDGPMKKERYTPGPWMVAGNGVVVVDGNEPGYALAYCQENKIEKVKANARLIAAAPDMLEACKMALQDLYYLGAKLKSIQVLEAAIKKALGE